MSGGIADTLAAHVIGWAYIDGPDESLGEVRCSCGWKSGYIREPFAAGRAHQAEALSSAGYGPLSALLDDLDSLHERIASPWSNSAVCRTCTDERGRPHTWPCPSAALLARYAPSDPTPKEHAVDSRPLMNCAAARDGECSARGCPQLRDGEPAATGRHCPIDKPWDDAL